jgi:NADH:ubiquinone oxidoreductase subunit 3 (subunit A)
MQWSLTKPDVTALVGAPDTESFEQPVCELGWAGYCEVLGFVAVLLATLIYLWKIGALDWTRSARQPR